jgi:hypothetical protein
VPDTNFAHSRADTRHRLPVVWIEPALDAVDLESGIATRAIRKSAQAIERVAKKDDGLHVAELISVLI